MKRRILLFTLLSACLPACAHVGSPDVFVETSAGPYKLYVTMQPPQVIPGVAAIEVRASGPVVTSITMTPMPLTGEGADHPPTPDAMRPSSQDPQFFTGSLWLMAGGSWQVRFQINGAAGRAVVSVPIPAVPLTTLKMTRGLGILLSLLGIVLVAGLVGVAAAAQREAHLPPGASPNPRNRKRAAIAAVVALVVLLAAAWFGGAWWNAEASTYANHVYRPLILRPTLHPAGVLELSITDPGDKGSSRFNFIPDHNHLMHLYAVRWPAIDVVYHLHPDQRDPGEFQLQLPAMPPGEYRLYADVVHANGFPETLTGHIEVGQISAGRPLIGDDATGSAPPIGSAHANANDFQLPDGYRMHWDRPSELVARKPYEFRFQLFDNDGKTPRDMSLYMGMNGHAAFIKDDGSVFAHVHPSGTASMAAMMLASAQNGGTMDMAAAPSDTVVFPYGFPKPGRYRIIIQMKHGPTIETAFFDTTVVTQP